MHRPSHPPWFNQPANILWSVQVMKLLSYTVIGSIPEFWNI
jgi:hypothetical protein